MSRSSTPAKNVLLTLALAGLVMSSGCTAMLQTADRRVEDENSPPPTVEVVDPLSGTQFHPLDRGFTYIIQQPNGNVTVLRTSNFSQANISENATVVFNGRRAAKLLHQRINEFRAKHNRTPSRYQPVLMSSARAKSYHMKKYDWVGHVFNKRTKTEIPDSANINISDIRENETIEGATEFFLRGDTETYVNSVYPPTDPGVSENVLANYGNISVRENATAENLTAEIAYEVFRMWKGSPPHRRLMLSQKWTLQGYGFAAKIKKVENGKAYYTIYGTIHFADPLCRDYEPQNPTELNNIWQDTVCEEREFPTGKPIANVSTGN